MNESALEGFVKIVELNSFSAAAEALYLSQSALSQHPHCVFFPAAFISVLLICFNEFGNGLRDAFNPSLRGAAGE